MAYVPNRVTVTAAASVLIAENDAPVAASDSRTRSYVIKNKTKTASVFLDGADTVTSNAPSFEWEIDDGPHAFQLEPGEKVYGRLAAGQANQTVHVASSGR